MGAILDNVFNIIRDGEIMNVEITSKFMEEIGKCLDDMRAIRQIQNGSVVKLEDDLYLIEDGWTSFGILNSEDFMDSVAMTIIGRWFTPVKESNDTIKTGDGPFCY